VSAGFTSGPWQWFPSVSKDRPAVIDTAIGVDSDNGTVIAEVQRGRQFAANANLIAAAPELYAKLEGLLEYVERSCANSSPTDAAVVDAIAALAKARGEA
jgi:hypothetical protein